MTKLPVKKKLGNIRHGERKYVQYCADHIKESERTNKEFSVVYVDRDVLFIFICLR